MGQVHRLRTRLSDEELLRTEFRLHDPENLPGLNRSVPDPDAHPTIIGYYDETPPGGRAANPNVPFIRCCHCGKRRHWKGYLLRDDHEQTYIIGARQCGREHYGARFDAAEKAFREEQARKRALSRWANMRTLLPNIIAEMEALLTCDGLRTIERKRDEIRRASNSAYEALVRHCGSGNPLIAVKEGRDYAAEADRKARYDRALASFLARPSEERRELRDQGLRPEEETAPIIVRNSEALGPLMGAGFLTEKGDARSALLALRQTLNAIQAIEQAGTSSATPTELNRLLREMTDRPKLLQEALHELAFAELFFAPDNLERMARWSRSATNFTLDHEDGRLIVQDSKRGRSIIERFGNLPFPETRTLSYFHYITEDFLPMTVEAA
jgi:hypothetical protein